MNGRANACAGARLAARQTYDGNDAGNPNFVPALSVVYEPRVGQRSFYPLVGQGLDDRMGLSVNLASGNLEVAAQDVRIAGTGLPLTLTRTYESLIDQVGETAFSPGWILDDAYTVRLRLFTDGIGYYGPGDVALFFRQNQDGSYTSPAGIDATLLNPSFGTYTLTFHETGVKDTFSEPPLPGPYAERTAISDQDGNTLSYALNQNGTTASVTDTQGRVLTFTYGDTNLPTSITKLTDWTGRSWQYGYDASGNLTQYTDPAQQLTQYRYTGTDLTQVTDPVGNVTAISYNPDHTVKQVTYGYGSTVAATYAFTYNAGNTVVTDPNNHQMTYYFDAYGRTTKVTDALGNSQQYSYTTDDHVHQHTDAKGQVFTYNYFDVGHPENLDSVVLPTGATRTWSYNDTSHPYYPTGYTDAQGHTVSYTYISQGNLATITDQLPSQNEAQIFYNSNGTVSYRLDFDGNRTDYGYDTKGNLTSVSPPAPLGGIGYTPDALSRLASQTDGKGQTTNFQYDAIDRQTLASYADSSQVAHGYDGAGNVTSMQDSTGTTTYHFDARNRQTQKILPGNVTLNYGYDGASNLTSYGDAGGTVAYHYNAGDELDYLQEPGGDPDELPVRPQPPAHEHQLPRQRRPHPDLR